MIGAAIALVLLCKFWMSRSWDEAISMQSQLEDLKSLFPKSGPMSEIVKLQSEHVEIISAKDYISPQSYQKYGRYNSYHDDLPVDSRHSSESPWLVNLDIHADVVFVGFPKSTLEYVRDNWFDHLGRKESLMTAFGGEFGEVVPLELDGVELTTSSHYHLVQISFVVSDVIRDRIVHLSGESDAINVWDLHDVLTSLAQAVASTHTVGTNVEESSAIQPSYSLFVLKIEELQAARLVDGFSTAELQQLAAMPDIVQLAHSLLKSEHVASRIDEVDPMRTPLHRAVAARLRDLELNVTNGAADWTPPSSESGIHWRDAVERTRKWASKLDGETKSWRQRSDKGLLGKARRVLDAKPSSYLYKHRQSLASAIVNTNKHPSRSFQAVCSASTWSAAGRVLWTAVNSQAGDFRGRRVTFIMVQIRRAIELSEGLAARQPQRAASAIGTG